MNRQLPYQLKGWIEDSIPIHPIWLMNQQPPLQPPFQSIDEPATAIPIERMDGRLNPNPSNLIDDPATTIATTIPIDWWTGNLHTSNLHTNRNGWIDASIPIHPIDWWSVITPIKKDGLMHQSQCIPLIDDRLEGLISQCQSIPWIDDRLSPYQSKWIDWCVNPNPSNRSMNGEQNGYHHTNRNGWIDMSIPIHSIDWMIESKWMDWCINPNSSNGLTIGYHYTNPIGWIDASIPIHPIDWWSVTTIPIERMDWCVNPYPSHRLMISYYHTNWKDGLICQSQPIQ